MHLAWHITRKVLLFVILAIVVAVIVWWRSDNSEFKQQSSGAGQTVIQVETIPSQTSFNKKQYSVNDPTSIWAVVNKGRALPSDYVPTDLVVPDINLGGKLPTLAQRRPRLKPHPLRLALIKSSIRSMTRPASGRLSTKAGSCRVIPSLPI